MLHANNRKDSEVIPSGSFQESSFRSPASSCSQKGCPSWKIKGSGVPRSMPSKVWLLPLAILWFKLGCPFSSLLKCTDYLLGWDFEQRPIIRVASEWPPSGCNSWTTVLTNRRKKSIHKWKFYASPLLSGASQVAPVVKNPPANAGHERHRFDPQVGGSPGVGNGNAIQYSCLENPTDRGAWWALVHTVAESDITKATLARYFRPSFVQF